MAALNDYNWDVAYSHEDGDLVNLFFVPALSRASFTSGRLVTSPATFWPWLPRAGCTDCPRRADAIAGRLHTHAQRY